MPAIFLVFIYDILATSTDHLQRVAVNDAVAGLTKPVFAVPLANGGLTTLTNLVTRGKAVAVWLVAATADPPVGGLLNNVFVGVGKEHVCPVKIIFHFSPP